MAFGRGKVILFGEHAVVHGCPAIAVGIDRGASAMATRLQAGKTRARFLPWELEVSPDANSDEPLARALAAVVASYPLQEALDIEVTVELPAGAGLGCSAALGVAILGAIDELTGRQRSDAEIGEAAIVWERVFHGNPSGIDNAISAVGGVATYTRAEGISQLRLARPLHLVVANSGETASTKEMVASVARQYDRDRERMTKNFEAIEAIVHNAVTSIQGGDPVATGQLMDMNHMILSSMMLSTPKLEALRVRAREAGALGTKLTGSGGGGCVVAIARDDADASSIANALGAGAFATVVGSPA